MKIYNRSINLSRWGGQTSILAAERTEEGKALRRLHGDKNASFRTKEYVPREDGVSNTISTIEKDNLLICRYG